MEDRSVVIIVGVVCVTAILVVALCMGVDGTLLATGIGAICTIIGTFFGISVEAKKAVAGPEKV